MKPLICILGLMCGALVVAPTGPCVLVCSAIGSGCGIWILYALCIGSLQVRLTSVLASALLVGYFGGTFYSIIMAILDGRELMAYVGVDPAWTGDALIVVLLACMTLILVGSMEPPLLREQHIVEMSSRQERFLWIVSAAGVYGYWSGRLAFRGMGGTVAGKINPANSVMLELISILPALAAIGFLQSSGMRRWRFGLIALIGLVENFPVGRRVFAYALLLAVFAGLRLSGRAVRISPMRKLMLAAGGVAVLVVASFLNVGMRMAVVFPSNGRSYNLRKTIDAAENTTFKEPQKVFSTMNQSVDARTSALTYSLALLVHSEETTAPLYGQIAIASLAESLPRSAYSAVDLSKNPVLARPGEKSLTNEHFGLPQVDSGSSIVSGGLADFGLAGALMYPLLVCILARVVLGVLFALFRDEGQILAILYLLSLFLASETILVDFLGTMRDLVVLLAVWAVLYSLPFMTRRDVERAPVFSQ